MALDVVILGPPGAGKGTQAQRISADTGVPHIATGDMLRAAIAAGTELGLEVKGIVDRGDLVPDALMIELIRARLEEDDTTDGFVLDGFPRTLAQAEALDRMLAEVGRGVSAVLNFQLPDEIAERRLLGRAVEQARSDDSPEVIRRRIEGQRVPESLSEYYRAQGILVGIHAELSVEQVYAEVLKVLEAAVAR